MFITYVFNFSEKKIADFNFSDFVDTLEILPFFPKNIHIHQKYLDL